MKIGEENVILLYDSGSSGYQLITRKRKWKEYSINHSLIKTETGNSWGKLLNIISTSANETIRFGDSELHLSEVTYVEGTSRMQNFLMALSGMQGMVGNKLFLGSRMV